MDEITARFAGLWAGFQSRDIVALGVFAVVLMAFAALMRFLAARAAAKATEGREPLPRDRFFHALRGPGELLFVLSALSVLLNTLTFAWVKSPIIHSAYTIAAIWLVAWIAVRATDLTAFLILKRHSGPNSDIANQKMVSTQVRILRKLITAIIILLAVASALMTFQAIRALGTSLLASAGVAGIVIGFAAQKTIGNFFTGFQIAITQPIRLGDNVIVEGDFGTVEEISLTYVTVRTWDLRRLILPVTYFVEKPFQNWTRQTSDLLTPIFLWVDFGMPVNELRREFERLLAATPLWNGKVKVVHVSDATDRAMQLRFLASADNADKNSDLGFYVREGMLTFIQKSYPQFLPRQRNVDFSEGEAKKPNGQQFTGRDGAQGAGGTVT